MVEFPSKNWKDYELLDSGDGQKLERFGAYVLARPEPKALWTKSLSPQEWDRLCHTRFKPGAGFGRAGKEDSGTWERLKKTDDQWYIRYPGGQDGPELKLRLGLTAFKHVGVFPEQAPNWVWIYRAVRHLASGGTGSGTCATLGNIRGGTASAVGSSEARRSPDPVPPEAGGTAPRVLNLFAYTGAASLAARAAGAEVTHLDSVRQVVTWARGNMEASGMDGIRWVVEDAMKFAHREQRRGNRYQGIILDPPAYGHGPDGEKWKLDECLFEMLRTVSGILDEHGFVVLNLYSNGYSALLGETLMREAFGKAGTLESGELALMDRFGKALPLSIFVRLQK